MVTKKSILMKVMIDKDLYKKLLPPGTSLFHQPEWLDIFCPDWQACIGMDDQQSAVWLWPYYLKTRYGIKKLGRASFSADNGVIPLKTSLNQTVDFSFNPLFSITEIHDRENRMEGKILPAKRCEVTQRQYQYFDLQTYPKDFSALNRTKKKLIRRSIPMEFVRFQSPKKAASLFEHQFQVIKMKFDKSEIIEWNRLISPYFDHYIFGIQDSSGDILAAQWLVGHDRKIHGWLGTRKAGLSIGGVTEWLMWNIIQWARGHYDIYDLGGSIIPGIRNFNLGMGTMEAKYSVYKIYNPAWMQKLMP